MFPNQLQRSAAKAMSLFPFNKDCVTIIKANRLIRQHSFWAYQFIVNTEYGIIMFARCWFVRLDILLKSAAHGFIKDILLYSILPWDEVVFGAEPDRFTNKIRNVASWITDDTICLADIYIH